MSHESNSTKRIESSDRTTTDPDPWQYRCPNGHTSWRSLATSDEYTCKTCGLRFGESELLNYRDRGASSHEAEEAPE